MKANSKEVVQGYVLTAAKYDFSRYEKLVLYKMVELAQADLKGKRLDAGYSINKTLFDDRVLRIPIKDFLPENDKNHAQVKLALTSLRNKTIEYEDAKEWRLLGIIEKPIVDKGSSFIEFEVQPMIWAAILNFSKGHSKYELNAAMSFKSVYAMRFYEMFYRNLKPITWNIEVLKERFGLSHKYLDRPADFVKYVVIAAKKEMDLKSEYSFNYSIQKTGRKITSILFVPYHIEANKNVDMEEYRLKKQVHLRFDLSKELIGFLNAMGFTNEGVRNNLKLFKEANNRIDLFKFLKGINRTAGEKRNPPAYVIGALKKYLDSKENVDKVDLDSKQKIDDVFNRIANLKKQK